MVDAADLSDKPIRLVVTVLAYVMVCVAMWMAGFPHQVRDVVSFVTATKTRTRATCLPGVILGALLVVLGLCVY
jgi:hypothetical protein